MHTHKPVSTRLPSWWRPLLTGVCVGVVGTTLALLLFALLIDKLSLPTAAVTPMAVAALGVGGLAGGFAAGLCGGRRGLLLGAVCGVLLFLILLIAGVAWGKALTPGYTVIKWAVLTACSAAGGVLGVNRRRP